LFYLGLFGIFSSPSAFAQSYPPGFNDELIVGSLNVPTAFTFDPDGRMYIAEQSGAIRIFEDDALLPDPAITIPVEAFDEQGLLGLALHPDFPAPPYLYVFYTPFTGNQTGNTNRVSRFTVGATTIDPASEVVLLPNIPAGLGFHLGGCVRFGGDGNLYISTGDTGWSTPYPQDLSLLQGKILRIRPDGTIPPNNPFVGVPGARPEIYQWGLRNPFRFSFQPGSSTPFIGDVGFESWEEIDKGVPGANFGWPICEGSCIPPNPNFVNPIYQYSHALGSAAIVGNLFYEGSHFPAQYAGNYFFFDHSRGHLGRMILDANNQVVSVTMPFLETASSGWLSGPVDLVLGPEGALYYCTYFPGEIRRIFYTGSGNRNPTAIAAANPQAGYPPLFVQFSSAGTYDVDGNPLTYDWNFGDGSPHSTSPNPTHTYNANGVYPTTLKVSDGLGGVDTSLPVTITVGNLPPALTILSPTAGSKFDVDVPVSFSGSGTDLEEGPLDASDLHWRVHLHHLNHIHPVILDYVGNAGSFMPSSHGEDLADIFYRITLWAEDSAGLRNEVFVDVLPDLASNIVTRTYTVNANDRDALSVLSDVRISGYNALNEPYDFVGADADQESAAMEFAIDLPPGSIVEDANLLVVAGPAQNASSTGALKIQLYNVDDALPFQDGPHGDLVNHHPTHPFFVSWTAGAPWIPGETYESADIAFLVQLWLNRPGYTPGKHLGIVVSEGSIQAGRYYGWADYAATEQAPTLRIRYSTPSSDSTGPNSTTHFALLPPTPNPFRDASTISYSLAAPSTVHLSIYDAGGRLVRKLVDGWEEAGTHRTTWDGRAQESTAAPGVYFLRLEANGESTTGRIVRLQ